MAHVNGRLRPLTTRLSSERVPRVKYSTLCPSRSDSPSAAIRAMPINFGWEETISGSNGSKVIGVGAVSPFVRLTITPKLKPVKPGKQTHRHAERETCLLLSRSTTGVSDSGRVGSIRVQTSLRDETSPLERAIPRVCGVNPTRLTCRNEPEGDDLCLDSAFVSDDMHVATTVINKRHSRCVHVRRATGIIPLILRHGSCCDDDWGMTKVRVPARASSWLPNIIQDVPV